MDNLVSWYDKVIRENQDARTIGWFAVGSPVEGIVICLIYALFVTLIGPKLMKNRAPLDIRNIMVVYNLGMVALSTYMVYLFLMGGWLTSYTFGCQHLDTSQSAQAMTMVWACYVFYLSKYVELLDTIFFILRKKFHLITFLHVFHHAIMPCSWWLGVKFTPGGMGTFHALLNSFVHVCMYTYYGLAALGPQYQKYLWWKKYITKIQITQFILVTIHSSQMFLTDCSYPKFFFYIIFSYAIIFLALFSNFYVQAYRKKRHLTTNMGTNTQNGGLKNSKMAANGCRGDVNMNRDYENGIASNGLKRD